MPTATRSKIHHTDPVRDNYRFNVNNYPWIDTPAGRVTLDFQTSGFKAEYNKSIGTGDNEYYEMFVNLRDDVTINGKTYDRVQGHMRGHQNTNTGEVFGFTHLYFPADDITSAAARTLGQAILPLVQKWIEQRGGVANLMQGARNNTRRREAEALERSAASNLKLAEQIRATMEE
jgi:hypothetical protein